MKIKDNINEIFQPYWEIFKNNQSIGKIYADEMEFKEEKHNGGLNKYKLLPTIMKLIKLPLGKTIPEYLPKQYTGRQSDFAIIDYRNNKIEVLNAVWHKPPFNFGKCLEDAGFIGTGYSDRTYYRDTGISIYQLNHKWYVYDSKGDSKLITPTPETAQILIEAANKLDKLKIMDTLERSE